MVRAFFIGLLCLPLLGAQRTAAPAQRRIALIVGNSDYTRLPPLPYVKRHVPLMAEALRNAGFEVHTIANFEWPAFIREQEREFKSRLRAGDVCFVYYSGYAIQVTDEDNYLLPVNFEPRDARPMDQRAYRFKRLQQDLDERGVALKIVLVDASPEIDAEINGVKLGEAGPGLMEPPVGDSSETFYVSAVFPGKWAPPVAAGGVGLLTAISAKHIAEVGLTLAEVFDRVKREVGEASEGKQIPDIRSSVVRQRFYFHAPVKVEPGPRPGIPVPSKIDREEYLWIPAGKFLMGCVPGRHALRRRRKTAARSDHLEAFLDRPQRGPGGIVSAVRPAAEGQ